MVTQYSGIIVDLRETGYIQKSYVHMRLVNIIHSPKHVQSIRTSIDTRVSHLHTPNKPYVHSIHYIYNVF